MPHVHVSTRRVAVRDRPVTANAATAVMTATRSRPTTRAAYVATFSVRGAAVIAGIAVAGPAAVVATCRADLATFVRLATIGPAASPSTTHAAASPAIAPRSARVASCATAAAAVRGRPRKVIPVALTK